MTWFLVSFLAYNCPGGWFGGLVPEAVRPLVCKPEIRTEPYDRLWRAQARVKALGPAALPRLTRVKGLRLAGLPVIWTQEVRFEED